MKSILKIIKISKLNCSSVIVKNLVFRQNATMSSIHQTIYGPENAVDGVYGQACEVSFVHSAAAEKTSSQWLRIEFGGWKHAGFVEIHNRAYYNIGIMQRLSNSFLYVYGENPTDNRQICAEDCRRRSSNSQFTMRKNTLRKRDRIVPTIQRSSSYTAYMRDHCLGLLTFLN